MSSKPSPKIMRWVMAIAQISCDGCCHHLNLYAMAAPITRNSRQWVPQLCTNAGNTPTPTPTNTQPSITTNKYSIYHHHHNNNTHNHNTAEE